MKKLLIFILLISQFAIAQNKVTLTGGSGSGGTSYTPGNDFTLVNDSLRNIGVVNIKDYGAVGDGVTNDLAAILAAYATGSKVIIPIGTFLVTGTSNTSLIVPSVGQVTEGYGPGSVIKTTSNARIFETNAYNIIRNLTLQGSSSRLSTALGFQSGISLSTNDTACVFDNIVFRDFGGDNSVLGGALYIAAIANNATMGTTVSNCKFFNCRTGLLIKARGEYTRFSNTDIINCGTAIYNGSGNSNLYGLTVQSCDTAYKLITGANDGHCVTAGGTFNHNTYNMVVDGILGGYLFNGLMMYAGDVIIRNSTGIRFVASDFSTGNATLTNSSNIQKVGCRWLNMTTNVVSGEDFSIIGDIREGSTAGYWIKQITADSSYFDGPFYVNLNSDAGTGVVRYNTSTKRFSYADITALTKNATIENPGASENIGIFRTPVAITITNTHAVLVGSASPSVTYQISFGTDITSLTNVYTAGQTVTSVTTGTAASGVNDATIPANSWVRVTTSAQSGTVGQISLSITYTQD